MQKGVNENALNINIHFAPVRRTWMFEVLFVRYVEDPGGIINSVRGRLTNLDDAVRGGIAYRR